MHSTNLNGCSPWSQRQSFSFPILERLGLNYSITGEFSRINRAKFDICGNLLGAACDNGRVTLWQLDPNDRSGTSTTSHIGDIYSIAFNTHNECITGGKDSTIQISKIKDDLQLDSILNLYCHESSVSFLECDPHDDNIILSASVDGTIRQYDRRMDKWGCKTNNHIQTVHGSMSKSANCVVSNVDNKEAFHSVKINPLFVHQMVVSSNDSIVKLYDRRMLSLGNSIVIAHQANKWEMGFCPMHLMHRAQPTYATYAEFSPCGKAIIATYHADHTYLFHLTPSSQRKGSSMNVQGEVSVVNGEHAMSHRAVETPWRRQLNSCNTIEEKTKMARSFRQYSSITADLKLYTQSDALGKAGEAAATAAMAQIHAELSHVHQTQDHHLDPKRLHVHQQYVLAREVAVKEYFYHQVLQRLKMYQERNFPGDKIASLLDLERILGYFPSDVEATLIKTKILIDLGFHEEAGVLLDELRYITELYSSGDLKNIIVLRSEIQQLKLLLDEHLELTNAASARLKSLQSGSATQEDVDSGLLHSLRGDASSTTGRKSLLGSVRVTEAEEDMWVFDSDLQHRWMFEGIYKGVVHIAEDTMEDTCMDRLQEHSANSHNAKLIVTAYSQRFIGALNIETSRLECCFAGMNGEYVGSASDDGCFYLWDRYSGELLFCRRADPHVLTTIQSHPHTFALVTGGSDNVARIWSMHNRVFGDLSSSNNIGSHPFTNNCQKLQLPEYVDLMLRAWLSEATADVSSSSPSSSPTSSPDDNIRNVSDNNASSLNRSVSFSLPLYHRLHQFRQQFDSTSSSTSSSSVNEMTSDEHRVVANSPHNVDSSSFQLLLDNGSNSGVKATDNAVPVPVLARIHVSITPVDEKVSSAEAASDNGPRLESDPSEAATTSDSHSHSNLQQEVETSPPYDGVSTTVAAASVAGTKRPNKRPFASMMDGPDDDDAVGLRLDSCTDDTTQQTSPTPLQDEQEEEEAKEEVTRQDGPFQDSQLHLQYLRSVAMSIVRDEELIHHPHLPHHSSSVASHSKRQRNAFVSAPDETHPHDSVHSNSDNSSSDPPSGDDTHDTTLLAYHNRLRRALAGHILDIDEIFALEDMVKVNQQTMRDYVDGLAS